MSKFKNFIALEIDDLAIRLVQMKKGRRTIELTSYNSISLPKGSVLNGIIERADQVQSCIKRAIQTAKGKRIRSQYVSLAIPEPHVFMSVISVDKKDENNADLIQMEALQNIPFNIEDILFDWEIINSNKNKTQISVGAIPKNIIEDYTKIIKSMDLIPISLEPESYALVRGIISPDFQHKTMLIIDFGASITTVLIVNNGTIFFTSSSSDFSGNTLTQHIADHLHLTPGQAEKAKCLFGLLPKQGKGEIRRTLLPRFNSLIQRIGVVEQFAINHLPVPLQRFTGILITGGGSTLPGLADTLAEELRVPVYQPLPLSINNIKNTLEIDDDMQRSLTTTLGLALRQ
ncbi:MAG: pilus assembly protein PilM [bacterium]